MGTVFQIAELRREALLADTLLHFDELPLIRRKPIGIRRRPFPIG